MLHADLLPPETVDRVPLPDEPPPVRGAQWDEVHGCWERWSDDDERWHLVGSVIDVPRPPADLEDVKDVIDLRDAALAERS